MSDHRWQQEAEEERMLHELALLHVVYHNGLKYEALELAAALGLTKQFMQQTQPNQIRTRYAQDLANDRIKVST